MIYSTDEIILKQITRDKFGETSSVDTNLKVRIEDNNGIFTGPDGQSIKPNSLVLADKTFPGKNGDKVVFYKIRNVLTGNTTEYEITGVFDGGGFGLSHKEVRIGSASG